MQFSTKTQMEETQGGKAGMKIISKGREAEGRGPPKKQLWAQRSILNKDKKLGAEGRGVGRGL